MIKMTETAAQKVKEDIDRRSLPETTVLRVDAERAEGQDKLKLSLRLDPEEPQEQDAVATTDGVRLAVNRDLAAAVGSAQLDFQPEQGGFVLARTEPTN